MSEIKKGDLAEVCNLPKDNQNIDIMVWSDAYDENYTIKRTLRYSDIVEALDES